MTGLAAEARIARRAGLSAVVGVARLDAIAADATCLVSFGIAGGLDPGLAAGAVVIAGSVVSASESWSGDPAWQARLDELAAALGAATGTVFGAAAIVATRTEKAALRAATGAAAVDLESAAVARAAVAAGIPFAVLRAIADTAAEDLPPAALVPLTERGTPALGAVLASLAGRPAQLGRVVRLALATRRALNALSGPAAALSGLLADP